MSIRCAELQERIIFEPVYINAIPLFTQKEFLHLPYLCFMPETKNPWLRYLLIDRLLNRQQKYLRLDELVEACLVELDIQVAKRTLEEDIRIMRNSPDILAPIAIKKGQGYYYSKPFSLNSPTLTENELQRLKQALLVLEQLKETGLNQELQSLITKLNLSLENLSGKPVLLLDRYELYSGYKHLAPLVNAIRNKQSIRFQYQKFDASLSREVQVSPLVLKEHLKRWYLLGYDAHSNTCKNYGLDRISHLRTETSIPYKAPDNFDAHDFFKNTFGISIGQPEDLVSIRMLVHKPLLYYLREAPWHSSMKIEEGNDSAWVSMQVFYGPELRKEILSWGASLEVLEPKWLREELAKEIEVLAKAYRQKT